MTVDCNWCTLKVSNDNMYALMCLNANDSEEDIILSEALVLDFLASQNIVSGINHIAISSFVEHAMYGQYICVAQGTPAAKGADGHYEFHKEMQDMKKKPLINQDGTADYKNSLNLAIISEGECLATYIPPTAGTEGIDVFGNVLPPLGNGKDALPLRGRGIYHDDSKTNYYAQYSGHIVMDGSAINIEKLYRVNGDLNIEIGNIRFDGDVEVCGDVRSGLEIDATGDVFIHGHVGGSLIKAGKNAVIDKGIQGRGICEIIAGNDIVCKFVESCYMEAGQNIYADSILNSHVIAKQQVLVTSKTGMVISSEVYGMTGVIVKEAGNDMSTSTLLRSGLPREEYARSIELKKLIKETDTKIDAFNQHLKIIEESTHNSKVPDPKLVETKMQIMRAKIVLDSSKKEYEDELRILKERTDKDAVHSFIRITGTVHIGVKIYIGMSPYLVNEAVREVTYRVMGNQVIALSNDEDDEMQKNPSPFCDEEGLTISCLNNSK